MNIPKPHRKTKPSFEIMMEVRSYSENNMIKFGLILILIIVLFNHQVFSQNDSFKIISSEYINDSVKAIITSDREILVYKEVKVSLDSTSLMPHFFGKYYHYNLKTGDTLSIGYFNENSQRHGLWLYNDIEKGIRIKKYFSHGIVLGQYEEFYLNGNPKVTGQFDTLIVESNIFTIKAGSWKYYYPNGVLESEGHFFKPKVSADLLRGKLIELNLQTSTSSSYFEDPLGIKRGIWYYYDYKGDLTKKIDHKEWDED